MPRSVAAQRLNDLATTFFVVKHDFSALLIGAKEEIIIIKICDAIMGTGKTQASIAYMNANPDKKFIFITPYLDEVKRIKNDCPALNFAEPSQKVSEGNYTKTGHTAILIEEERNIVTTHQAFKYYTNEMLDKIREIGYTLFIDESLGALEKCEVNVGDLELLIQTGYIKEVEDGEYSLIKDDYDGEAFSDVFRILKSRNLRRLSRLGDVELFYWSLPADMIAAFKDVFLLTYQFEGQTMKAMLDMNGMPYEFIGVERDDGGGFQFCDGPGYVPEYVKNLPDMIHIVDNKRMNEVGEKYHALSLSWFEKNASEVRQLKNNLYNYFTNVGRSEPASERMWSTFKRAHSKLKGKGYTKQFTECNLRATNAYRNKTRLAYCVNLFMNVGERMYYRNHGVEIDEDLYALSNMIQWIWRSAIRDGKPITVYIPSRRMRTLLINWINEVSGN